MYPPLPSLRTAIAQLHRHQFSTPKCIESLSQWQITPQKAIVYLEGLVLHHQLLKLYQQIFPEEFKQSTADSRYDICHSAKEIEFLELIHHHYFPVPWLDEWESDENLFCSAVFIPTLNWCWEEFDFYYDSELSLLQQLLVGLNGQWDEFLNSQFQMGFKLDSRPIPKDAISLSQLDEASSRLDWPLSYFATCWKVATFQIDNPYFVHPYEEEWWEWSLENIQRLKIIFAHAQGIAAQFTQLSDYLDDYPQAIQQLITCWNTAYAQ